MGTFETLQIYRLTFFVCSLSFTAIPTFGRENKV